MSLMKRIYLHLHSIYPEITDYLEEKLTDPEWLADLNERLEGLAMAYEEDKKHYAVPHL